MRYLLNIDDRLCINDETASKLWKLPAYVQFHGPFTEDASVKFRENLEVAENLALKCGQEYIPITIDSYGGSVYALLGMIDAIQQCSVKVSTIVESKAMSCGAVLFACGAEGYRFIGPNATVMIHTVSSISWGKVDELKASTTEADRLNDKLFEMMSINCGHKPDYFSNELKNRKMADWYLDAKDCLQHNLASKIHLPSIKVSVKYDFKYE